MSVVSVVCCQVEVSDELITRPEESYRLCCVVVCDLETSRMGAPYIYDISSLKVNVVFEDDISELFIPCEVLQPFSNSRHVIKILPGTS